jgi:hypothetical protein
MDPGTPERLVGVDVAEARDGALIEDGRLDRRPPPGERASEASRREGSPERLRPQSAVPEGIELIRRYELPGPEAANIAIGDVRSVV